MGSAPGHESQGDDVESVENTAGMSRRRMLQLMGTAAVAVPALGSLTGGSAAAARSAPGRLRASGETVELTLAYLGDATQQATWEALFAEFNKANPNITIKATGLAAGNWGSYVSTVATQIAGGAKYDIVYVATEGQRLFTSKDLLLPLDDYIAADQEAIDDYYADVPANLLEWTQTYGSPDGQTYFIPGGYNTVVMYCNIEVFEAAGATLPEADWTWDEFYEAGLAIKENGGYIYPLGSDFPFVQTMPWLLTNGASTMDADWATATYNSPEAVEAAEFVKKCIDDGISPEPGGEFDALAQMADGKLAAIGGGRWVTGDIRRNELVDKVRIVNWPTKAGNGSPIGWDGWPIMKTSEHPDEAWQFLKWLTTTEASVYYAEQGGTNVPARNSVATSESFLRDAPAGSELLPAAVEYATPIPSPDNLPEVEAAINDGWTAAITGNQDAQEALDAANEAIQAVL